jgi:septum formation protein
VEFEIQEPRLAEEVVAGASPRGLAEHLARAKALSVARRRETGVVIAADTVVVRGREIMGKPRDTEDARRMLRRLAGASHLVVTGVCVVDAGTGQELVESEVTAVRFRPLSEDEVEAYLATGEPLDKAGAYGIQGYGGLLVERIEGCYYNVVGLPLARLYLMLRQLGIDLLAGGRGR